MIEQYPELSDDNHIAFIQLEMEFRKEFDSKIGDPNSNYNIEAAVYMHNTLAAATALDIEALRDYRVDTSDNQKFCETFTEFSREVAGIIIQMRIHQTRKSKELSVGLSSEAKTKIHTLIEKIREEIERSSASVDKKERVFDIIGNLLKEIDKPRTRFERFGDLARGLSGISTELSSGAEPWWKWFKGALRIVDEEKEREPRLPKPKEVKRIEPPRREISKPEGNDLDDDVPF